MKSLQLLTWIIITLATAAPPALAQTTNTPPARIGNVWDGRSHEPNPAAVNGDLKALGDAPNPTRERVATDEVEDLYQQLIKQEANRGLLSPPTDHASSTAQPGQPNPR